ncbi:MAG: hypothetical protein WD844_12725 [Thermoleophilaceae bacterium]
MNPRRLALPAVLLAAAFAAPPAHAADPIEGTWFFEGGQVEVEPTGPDRFSGTVTRATRFADCVHPAGQLMWKLERGADGVYRGTHIRYIVGSCQELPNSPTIWRVREEQDRQVLDFCSNDPRDGAPTEFGPSCIQLERAKRAPDRTKACARGQEVCVRGATDLRRIGCVRPTRRHGFSLLIARRGRDRLVSPRSRVRLVRFSLDGGRARTDRRRPFRNTVSASRLAPGPHILRATVSLRSPNRRKAVTRRVVYRFNVCER